MRLPKSMKLSCDCPNCAAISAVYRVVEKYPAYALAQMNDLLAAEIVEAVTSAVTRPNGETP